MCPCIQRFAYSSFQYLLKSVNRYKGLNKCDKLKLLEEHKIQTLEPEQLSKIEESLQVSLDTHKPTSHDVSSTAISALPYRIRQELSRLTLRPKAQKQLASTKTVIGLGKSKFFMGIDPNTELEHYDIKAPLFSQENETQSLIHDVKESNRYEGVREILESLRPVREDSPTDYFMHIFARAVEKSASHIERSALVNELSDYECAYAMKRAALRNLLINKCTRNAFEESRVDAFLDKQAALFRQRFSAPSPPQLFEPLLAFNGIVNYSASPLERLKQKLVGIKILLDGLVTGDPNILQRLPELVGHVKSNYPFANYYGFKSSVPDDVTGAIQMGRGASVDSYPIRYPNLQSVAHSLPMDPKYRAIVTHAIRVLERVKGWDHLSKVKAINRLVGVYNNLAPSGYYAGVFGRAIPVSGRKGRLVYTRSRVEVFNSGLNYIGSLTRNHWTRSQKAKSKGKGSKTANQA